MTPEKILPLFQDCVCGDPACTIPFGLCHCGCGNKTKIASVNEYRSKQRKGLPYCFISGHNNRRKHGPDGCVCGLLDCGIPFGECHCGCGGKTNIAVSTDREAGRFIGLPFKFIRGHSSIIRPIIDDAVPFKIEGVYCRLIPLTQGQYAIVWESDYRWLMQWKWFAYWSPKTKTFYAIRNVIGRRIHYFHASGDYGPQTWR